MQRASSSSSWASSLPSASGISSSSLDPSSSSSAWCSGSSGILETWRCHWKSYSPNETRGFFICRTKAFSDDWYWKVKPKLQLQVQIFKLKALESRHFVFWSGLNNALFSLKGHNSQLLLDLSGEGWLYICFTTQRESDGHLYAEHLRLLCHDDSILGILCVRRYIVILLPNHVNSGHFSWFVLLHFSFLGVLLWQSLCSIFAHFHSISTLMMLLKVDLNGFLFFIDFLLKAVVPHQQFLWRFSCCEIWEYSTHSAENQSNWVH